MGMVILTRLRLVKVPAIDGRIVIQSPSGLVRTVVVIPVELRPPTIFHVTDGSESRISALTIEIDQYKPSVARGSSSRMASQSQPWSISFILWLLCDSETPPPNHAGCPSVGPVDRLILACTAWPSIGTTRHAHIAT